MPPIVPAPVRSLDFDRIDFDIVATSPGNWSVVVATMDAWDLIPKLDRPPMSVIGDGYVVGLTPPGHHQERPALRIFGGS